MSLETGGADMVDANTDIGLDRLVAEMMGRRGDLLVVTGAGISVASGIATFRDGPDAVWSKDVMTMGTRAFFMAHPVEAWRWYLDRFKAVFDASPNAGHRALVDLEEQWWRLGSEALLVTQNIDGLHRAAGHDGCIEVHGRASEVRCVRRACAHGAPKGSLARPQEALRRFSQAPSREHLPRCPTCDGLLRPHVLWFDETYDSHHHYRADEVWRAAKTASIVVFVGTSFAVGLTDHVLELALSRGAFLTSIDPSGQLPHRKVHPIRAPAEVALPRLVAALRSTLQT